MSSASGRVHSVKVPRLYKVASKLLKEHQQSLVNVKTLAFRDETRKLHPNIKALYALLAESARRSKTLDRILEGSQLLSREPGLDPHLARVLVTELLFGKGVLPGESRPVKAVKAHEEELRREARKQQEGGRTAPFPRYARVNRLKTTMEEVKSQLESEGWEEQRVSTESFPSLASRLEPHQFVRDPFLPDVLAFAPGTSFYGHHLYSDGLLLLQDRASCLPVTALSLSPGAVVLDACAAPGMKTAQAAAAVGRGGKVYAVERDQRRCQLLRKMLSDAGAAEGITQVINMDFLKLRPESYPDVQHVILDPSCSGSGTQLEKSQSLYYVYIQLAQEITFAILIFKRHGPERFHGPGRGAPAEALLPPGKAVCPRFGLPEFAFRGLFDMLHPQGRE